MTKSKKTKKALLASVLSMMLCVAMLAGTTFAWFTDTAGSDNNRIKSGNLRINLLGRAQGETYNADLAYGEVSDSDKLFAKGIQWEPGQVHYRELKVVNEGDLAAKFSVNLNGDAFQMNYRVDPTDTEDEYVWTDRNLVEVIKVAVYEGTFKELVIAVNEVNKQEAIEALEGALTALEEGEELPEEDEELPEEGGEPEVEAYADGDENAETSSESTGESTMPDPWEDWGGYVTYIQAEMNEYDDEIQYEINTYLGLLEDAVNEGDVATYKEAIVAAVNRHYDMEEAANADANRKCQLYKEAIASLQAHSEKKYTEKDRDVVTVAVALCELGKLEELKVEESFAETTLFEGTLAPRGEEKGEGEDKILDNKVFTLIAFWPEGGESDNECNLKNGRRATTLMTSEDIDKFEDGVPAGEKYEGTLERSLQIEFDILVLAKQAPVEDDFFDNKYDELAEWPTLATEESGTSGESETPVTPEETT